MVKRLFLGAFILISTSLFSQEKILSEKSFVSLITVDSGDELYSIFGHSAIRVNDSINKIDLVYNYGTFDFETPNFYLKFANGNLKYMLAYGQFRYMLPYYNQEQRGVKEQILNLSLDERQILFNLLSENLKPENRYYRYDFFFDNCATRLRDLVFHSIKGKVLFDSSQTSGLTYRQLYSTCLQQRPWTQFGIHLLLGMKADKPSNANTEMFLPVYLFNQFGSIRIENDEQLRPLVLESKDLLSFNKADESQSFLTPQFFFWSFLIIVLVLMFVLKKQGDVFFRFFDPLLFTVIALTSLLLLFLAFFTRHQVTSENFNLLWASPLYCIALFFIKHNKWMVSRVIFGLILLSQFVLLAGWMWIPQEFPNGLLPFVLIVFLRTSKYLSISKSIK